MMGWGAWEMNQRKVTSCVRNLQQFQYGHILQELSSEHDVSLERCHNQCIGCRIHPALMIDGRWVPVENIEKMKNAVDGSISK
jgi:hypothetical protein